MSFLGLSEKTLLVVGYANKKSIAWAIAKSLENEGRVIIPSATKKKGRT